MERLAQAALPGVASLVQVAVKLRVGTSIGSREQSLPQGALPRVPPEVPPQWIFFFRRNSFLILVRSWMTSLAFSRAMARTLSCSGSAFFTSAGFIATVVGLGHLT